jgi:DNA-binding transcriptional MerR regulator
VSSDELLSIGRFSRLSGLTVKALRRYGDARLLVPAHVDQATGYRSYTRAQVHEAVAIRRLRSFGVPLAEIAAILRGDDVPDRLEAHRERLRRELTGLERSLSELTLVIDGEEALVPEPADVLYELKIKDFDEQPVLSIRDRVSADTVKDVIPAHYAEVFAYLRELGVEPVEPWTITVCPFADETGLVELENAVCVAEPQPGRGRIESRTLPACTAFCLVHRGPYTELSRSYRALSEWVDLYDFVTAGPPREIYWTDPQKTPDPADYVTELVWPVEPDRAKLEAFTRRSSEKFERPLPA